MFKESNRTFIPLRLSLSLGCFRICFCGFEGSCGVPLILLRCRQSVLSTSNSVIGFRFGLLSFSERSSGFIGIVLGSLCRLLCFLGSFLCGISSFLRCSRGLLGIREILSCSISLGLSFLEGILLGLQILSRLICCGLFLPVRQPDLLQQPSPPPQRLSRHRRHRYLP